MKTKTAFLTGSTGFIGKQLLFKLLNHNYRVYSLVRDNNQFSSSLYSHPQLITLKGKLSDLTVLRKGTADAIVVFHLASSLRLFEKRTELYHTNIKGTENLLKACGQANRKIRFIFTSSIEAIGPSSQESAKPPDTPSPITDYGKSKLQAEKIIRAFCQTHPNVTYTIVRAGNVYDLQNGIVKAIAEILKSGGWKAALLYHMFKDHSFSLIHLRDLLDILTLVAVSEQAENKTYFAVGESLSIKKIISIIEQGSRVKKELPTTAFSKTMLAFWNLGIKATKQSDLISYLSLCGKRKFQNYYDDHIVADLHYIPKTRFDLCFKQSIQ